MHIEDLNILILKQILSISRINNLTLNVGGGLRNKISLIDLTKKCEKITNNVCKKSKIKSTSNYDIPYYVTDIKMVKKLYKWMPKRNINIILKDIYKWLIRNKNLINKF